MNWWPQLGPWEPLPSVNCGNGGHRIREPLEQAWLPQSMLSKFPHDAWWRVPRLRANLMQISPLLLLSTVSVHLPREPRPSTSCACVQAQLLQSCLTLCNPMDCSPPGSSVHGIPQARILVGSHALLHGIFLTQVLTLCLLLYLLSHWGSPQVLPTRGPTLLAESWEPHVDTQQGPCLWLVCLISLSFCFLIWKKD